MLGVFELFEEGLHDVFGGGSTSPSALKINSFDIGGGTTRMGGGSTSPECGIGISGFKPQIQVS